MYDLIIIGAGPAGLTASIYASCFKLNHLLIGKEPGGQMSLAPDILNYPGFEEISGQELTSRMVKQVKTRGATMIIEGVTSVENKQSFFDVVTESGKKYETKSIILATGVERRKLNILGENEYTGKGLSYCAKCDRHDYENKVCAVVGGANSAAQTAVQLAHVASKVYVIYRGNRLRCDQIWMDHIKENPRIELIYSAKLIEIKGNNQTLTNVLIQSTDVQRNSSSPLELSIDRLYIEIGGVPGTAILIQLGIKMDAGGFLEVDDKLATMVPGIFAAGDVISHRYSIEQISSAVGLGARAAQSAFSFLKQQKAPTLWGASQINRT